MPDSTQDTEVDEVLAAIRRLIAEGPAGGRPAAPARLAPLVLTPAHRVGAGDDRPLSPSLRTGPPAEHPVPGNAPVFADRSALLAEPAPGAAPSASEPLALGGAPREPLVLRADPPPADSPDAAAPGLVGSAGSPSDAPAPEAKPAALEPLILGAEPAPPEALLASEDASPAAGLTDPDGDRPPVAADDPHQSAALLAEPPELPADPSPEPLVLDGAEGPGPLVLNDPLPPAASPLVLDDPLPLAASLPWTAEPVMPEGDEDRALSPTGEAVPPGPDAVPSGEGGDPEPLPDLRLPWEDPAAQDPLRDRGSSWAEPDGAAGHGRLDLGPFSASDDAEGASAPDAPSSGAEGEDAILAAVLSAAAATDPAPPPAEADLRALVADLVREEVRREVAGLRDMIREEVRAALHPSGPG